MILKQQCTYKLNVCVLKITKMVSNNQNDPELSMNKSFSGFCSTEFLECYVKLGLSSGINPIITHQYFHGLLFFNFLEPDSK